MTISAGTVDLGYLTIQEAAALIAARKISPIQLTYHALTRIERLNSRGNFFLTVDYDGALQAARKAEEEIMRDGPKSPLHGIPFSLKDNIETAGIRTTAGSLILRDNIPSKDSDIARRLKEAGAILLGKTNMHEFAYGITGENQHYGHVSNPWNYDHIAGGSTGGSAGSLCLGIGYGAVGTDTGGSIRIPSSFCGITGLKPTFDLVSVEGTIPLAKSFDHAGPLGRRVSDVGTLLDVLAVRDYMCHDAGKPETYRIGWPVNYYYDFLDDEVYQMLEQAAECFRLLGMEIQEVHLPTLPSSMEAATTISLAEATAWHEAQGFYPQRAAQYCPDVRGRLAMGYDVSAVRYLRSFEVRRQLIADFDRVFASVDAILVPATPTTAPEVGKTEVAFAGKTETLRTAIMRLNRPTNVSGHPSLCVPCGFTEYGLPVGMQLIGPWWSEKKLMSIATLYEEANEWYRCRPDPEGVPIEGLIRQSR